MNRKNNRTRVPEDGVILTAFTSACLKFFGWSALLLGSVSTLIGVHSFMKTAHAADLVDGAVFVTIGTVLLYISRRHSRKAIR